MRYSHRNQFISEEAPRTGFLTKLKAAFTPILLGTGLSLGSDRDAEKSQQKISSVGRWC